MNIPFSRHPVSLRWRRWLRVFVRKNYKQAGANFIKSYKESPNGNKAYESLLKLATSFSHLDKKKEACSVINKLDGFNSKLANNLKQRVREESSRIGCK